MSRILAASTMTAVLIHLQVDAEEPPVGRVGPAGGLQRPFTGWLELLRVLSELLGEEQFPGGR